MIYRNTCCKRIQILLLLRMCNTNCNVTDICDIVLCKRCMYPSLNMIYAMNLHQSPFCVLDSWKGIILSLWRSKNSCRCTMVLTIYMFYGRLLYQMTISYPWATEKYPILSSKVLPFNKSCKSRTWTWFIVLLESSKK